MICHREACIKCLVSPCTNDPTLLPKVSAPVPLTKNEACRVMVTPERIRKAPFSRTVWLHSQYRELLHSSLGSPHSHRHHGMRNPNSSTGTWILAEFQLGLKYRLPRCWGLPGHLPAQGRLPPFLLAARRHTGTPRLRGTRKRPRVRYLSSHKDK